MKHFTTSSKTWMHTITSCTTHPQTTVFLKTAQSSHDLKNKSTKSRMRDFFWFLSFCMFCVQSVDLSVGESGSSLVLQWLMACLCTLRTCCAYRAGLHIDRKCWAKHIAALGSLGAKPLVTEAEVTESAWEVTLGLHCLVSRAFELKLCANQLICYEAS